MSIAKVAQQNTAEKLLQVQLDIPKLPKKAPPLGQMTVFIFGSDKITHGAEYHSTTSNLA